MSETKWTPGEWENQGEDAFADMPFIRIGKGDRPIADVIPSPELDELDDETRANANLIVAAKKLYEAAHDALSVFEGMARGDFKMNGASHKSAMKSLREAMAKAEGEAVTTP